MRVQQQAVKVYDSENTVPPWDLEVSEELVDIRPEKGEAVVKLSAAPVHSFDNYLTYPKTYIQAPTPSVPGLEGVGVVQEVGAECDGIVVGTRVVLFNMPVSQGRGTWQRYVSLPASSMMPVPESVPDHAAAQAYINPVTAFCLLEELRPPPGCWILQNASSSTVGKLIVQMAKAKGIKTINLIRSQNSAESLQNLGGDAVIVTTEDVDIAAKVESITSGAMAFGALDAVGGSMTGSLLAAVRPGGTTLVYGVLGSTKIEANATDLLFQRKILSGFGMRGWWNQQTWGRQKEVMAKMLQWLADGLISIPAGKGYPLEQAAEAVLLTTQSGRGPKPILLLG